MKKVVITEKSDLNAIAQELTCDSELYGDEISSVVSDFTRILNSARELGCILEERVRDSWGGSFLVVAVPTVRRHHWSF